MNLIERKRQRRMAIARWIFILICLPPAIAAWWRFPSDLVAIPMVAVFFAFMLWRLR